MRLTGGHRPHVRLRAIAHTLLMAALMALALSSGMRPAAAQSVEPAALASLDGRALDAKPVSLQSLRGKVVVVVFWSTACAVCRDTLPELRANHAGWRGKPFELLTVSVDATREDAAQYQRLLEQLLPNAEHFPSLWRGEPGHRDNFGTLPPTLPATFIVDRAGRVVDRLNGRIPPEAWDRVAELLP